MKISLIVAAAENGVIGRAGDLPWRLSADLKRFKALTMGHHLLIGRKTYESIGRPLPGRRMLVLSRRTDLALDGVEVVPHLDAAFSRARERGEDELFVGGGEQIYRLALPLADRVYRTIVQARVDGDATFPALPEDRWRIEEETPFPVDDRNEYPTLYQRLERISTD